MKYDVFVSYRRSSFESANLISEKLRSKGYNVFFDVETLRAGKFNEQLLSVIDNCNDFVLVLPPDALSRCHDKNDWVRIEVLHAIEKGKNIIPIMLSNFEWPSPMPEGLEDICNYQSIKAGDSEFFDMSIQRLISYLKSKPHKNLRYFYKKLMVTAVFMLLCIGTGLFTFQYSAKKLCNDVAICLTTEMEILDILIKIENTTYDLWKDYRNQISETNKRDTASLQQLLIKVNNMLDFRYNEILNLNSKVDKYTDISSYERFLLGFYDIDPQDISAFNNFYDAMFETAKNNFTFMRNLNTPNVSKYSLEMLDTMVENFKYPINALYYNYMSLISLMPDNAKQYYYEHSNWNNIDVKTDLSKTLSEYEKLSTEQMMKYQQGSTKMKYIVEKQKEKAQNMTKK